jgi:Xaa-Pro dipeptidase
MREHGLDALIATKPQTFFYLSDFNPVLFSHPTIVILPVEGHPTMLVWAIRLEHARAEGVVEDIRLFGRWADKPYVALDPYEALAKVLDERGLVSLVLGVEEDHLSVKTFQRLRDLLPRGSLKDASSIVTHARLVKDEEEISRLRRAAEIADAGMTAAVDAIHEGSTEVEVAVQAEVRMRQFWSSKYPDHEVTGFAGNEGAIWSGLWCWVVSGERLSVTDAPKSRIIRNGDMVLPHIWAISDGYTAENERTVGVGAISSDARLAFEAMIAAREEALRAIRAGVGCAAVYEAAADVLRRHGYGRFLPGRIGHSIGLGPHEQLSLGPEEKVELEEGMVVTVEPTVPFPGGNVRHSDTLVVTAAGHEMLTRTPGGVLTV